MWYQYRKASHSHIGYQARADETANIYAQTPSMSIPLIPAVTIATPFVPLSFPTRLSYSRRRSGYKPHRPCFPLIPLPFPLP